LMIASLAVAPRVALGQTAAAKVDDGALKTTIETRIKANSTLKDDNIDISVDHGLVTLTGTVDSRAESQRAATLAKVAGVTKVENKLEVHSDAAGTTGKTVDKMESKTEKTADKVVDETKKAGKATGKATKDAASEVGEAVTDAWITSAIKTDFVDEDTLKGSHINVDTDNHVVTLKGTVASEAGRARAIQIAKTTKGVSRVVDTLTIAK